MSNKYSTAIGEASTAYNTCIRYLKKEGAGGYYKGRIYAIKDFEAKLEEMARIGLEFHEPISDNDRQVRDYLNAVSEVLYLFKKELEEH